MVLLFLVILAVLIWSIQMELEPARKAEALAEHSCPACQHQVDFDALVCHHCQQQLRETCQNCRHSKLINHRFCPHCGTPKEQG